MRLKDADALLDTILRDKKLDGKDVNWAVNRIISHILNAPTVERILCRSRDWSNECTHSSSFEQGYVQGYEDGKNERPKDKWSNHGYDNEEDGLPEYVCPMCGKNVFENVYNYCPICGARLER